MSSIRKETMTCPFCHEKQEATLYLSVNTMLNPELVPKLLNGGLRIHTCRKCGAEIELVYPILVNHTSIGDSYMVTFDKHSDSKDTPKVTGDQWVQELLRGMSGGGFLKTEVHRETYSDWQEFVKRVNDVYQS